MQLPAALRNTFNVPELHNFFSVSDTIDGLASEEHKRSALKKGTSMKSDMT